MPPLLTQKSPYPAPQTPRFRASTPAPTPESTRIPSQASPLTLMLVPLLSPMQCQRSSPAPRISPAILSPHQPIPRISASTLPLNTSPPSLLSIQPPLPNRIDPAQTHPFSLVFSTPVLRYPKGSPSHMVFKPLGYQKTMSRGGHH